MSEETPAAPPAQESTVVVTPPLAPAPRQVFRVLIWTALILLAVGIVIWLFNLAQAGGAYYAADADIMRAAGVAAIFQWAGYAVPFFVGAGVVAGLGKRVGD